MKALLVFAFLGLAAKASVVYFDSSALTTANNSGFGTVDLTEPAHPDPEWAPALPDSDWISFGPTGDLDDPGFFRPRDRAVVTFTTLFDVTGLILDASLTVLAEDSTSVILNGHTLFAEHPPRRPFCEPRARECVTSTEEFFTFAELAPYLVEGANELSFKVSQAGANCFGLDFAGKVDLASTPEPATAAFLGAGLLALALWRRPK